MTVEALDKIEKLLDKNIKKEKEKNEWLIKKGFEENHPDGV